jgi:hypothetical protein
MMKQILGDINKSTFKPFQFPPQNLKKMLVNHKAFMSDPDSVEETSPKFTLNSKALSTTEDTMFTNNKPLWNKDSSSDISESEIISLVKEVDRTPGYLSQFTHINFDWDQSCLSQYLMSDLSEEERDIYFGGSDSEHIPDVSHASNRSCKAVTSLHSFKTAFGTFALRVGQRYYFRVHCVRGSNFKIGIAASAARLEPDIAFSDTDQGWAYYSNGQTRHNSKGFGSNYGETFKGKDTIGVYVDLVLGTVFFEKNGKVFGDAFTSDRFTDPTNLFFPACSCLTKDETFEVLFPRRED